ncbi:MAG: hypothetical protein M3P39_12080 [Actinomycetota bacterium]|nr:hypothetical protein [Actinomycetota bacterium]
MPDGYVIDLRQTTVDELAEFCGFGTRDAWRTKMGGPYKTVGYHELAARIGMQVPPFLTPKQRDEILVAYNKRRS